MITVIIALESAVGGVWDVLERQLGCPWYVAVILGVWKIPGALILVAPRFPRLKEWAYAGAFFNFSGAVTSLLVSGSAWYHVAYTSLFALCTLASWALRPGNRVLGRIGLPS